MFLLLKSVTEKRKTLSVTTLQIQRSKLPATRVQTMAELEVVGRAHKNVMVGAALIMASSSMT
jgi:hypothetical protein